MSAERTLRTTSSLDSMSSPGEDVGSERIESTVTPMNGDHNHRLMIDEALASDNIVIRGIGLAVLHIRSAVRASFARGGTGI